MDCAVCNGTGSENIAMDGPPAHLPCSACGGLGKLDPAIPGNEGRCMRCGGVTRKQQVFNNCHRFKDDCIAHLRLAVKQLEPRAAFGDQCWQDQCENAYVEQSVLIRLRRLAENAPHSPNCDSSRRANTPAEMCTCWKTALATPTKEKP
jgi:hypothetical protein